MPAKSARGKRAAARPADAAELADRLHSAAIHLLRRLRREDDASGLAGAAAVGAVRDRVRRPDHSRRARRGRAGSSADDLEAGCYARGGRPRRREVDETDRRVMRVRATARGTRLLQEGRTRRVASLAAALGRFRRAIAPRSPAPCRCSRESCAAPDPGSVGDRPRVRGRDRRHPPLVGILRRPLRSRPIVHNLGSD